MRSARLTILLTPEAKASIEAQAKALGITSSELVRRAVEAYDPDRNDGTLRLLAEELAAVVEQTEAKVDAALAELQAMRHYFEEIDLGRSRALRMSTIDSLLKSIRQVILMESKLQQLADGLQDVSKRVIDHEGRLIRIETLVEIAQRRPGPPRIGEGQDN